MIVVADSGPLNYLILLDHAELLHRFYGEVVIPDAVAVELSSRRRRMRCAIGCHMRRPGCASFPSIPTGFTPSLPTWI
jgi:hypothetical protein